MIASITALILCAAAAAQDGACCLNNGVCEQVSEGTCAAIRGQFQGPGIDCNHVYCPDIAPDNDLCIEAIEITCGEVVFGATIDSTIGPTQLMQAAIACGTPITAPGVWYTITGTGGDITLSTCNQASYDSKITVFDASLGCAQLVCIAGVDDALPCGVTTILTFRSVPGVTYAILVHGFTGETGIFDMEVICAEPVGACCFPCDCIEDNASNCAAMGGTYQGDGALCEQICPGPAPIGACCVGETCIDTCAADCALMGGAFEGDGSRCTGAFGGIDANGPWTLHVSDNADFDNTQFFRWELTINGATSEESIRNNPVVPDGDPAGVSDTLMLTGAGTVQTVEIAIEMSSTWMGDLIIELEGPNGTRLPLISRVGSVADSPDDFGDSSDLLGTYRFRDGATQTMLDRAAELGASGVLPTAQPYRATGVDDVTPVALDAPSGDACAADPCPCEIDGMPGVSVQDLLGYLALWFAGDPAADRAAPPAIDVSDLLTFLACWFEGCG